MCRSASTPTRVLTARRVAAAGPVSQGRRPRRRSGSARSSGWRRCLASRPRRSPTAGRRARAAREQLRSRGSPDAGRPEPADLPVGGRLARVLQGGRPDAPARDGCSTSDSLDAPDVVVVDRAWAERFFPGEQVLGRRFRNGGCTTCAWTTVVGVVGNVRWTGLDAPDDGTVYWPLVDLPQSRSSSSARRASPRRWRRRASGRARARSGSGAAGRRDGDELVSNSLATPRYLSVLVGMFARRRCVLSIVGIYGVMTYFVQQHTRDIGIRLALGGDPCASCAGS